MPAGCHCPPRTLACCLTLVVAVAAMQVLKYAEGMLAPRERFSLPYSALKGLQLSPNRCCCHLVQRLNAVQALPRTSLWVKWPSKAPNCSFLHLHHHVQLWALPESWSERNRNTYRCTHTQNAPQEFCKQCSAFLGTYSSSKL